MVDPLRGYAILAVVLVHTESWANVGDGMLKVSVRSGTYGGKGAPTDKVWAWQQSNQNRYTCMAEWWI